MNCSLAVLCWIAISTLLGIFFGYSSLELTTSTSIVALLLGLVLAGTPLFLQRGGIRIDPPDRRQFVAFAMSIFFLVFAVREFGQVVFVAKDEIRVISPNNLGDICLHLTQINYLASGPHFWPENPIFAFDKLRYPIGLNVFNAELKLVGIEPKLGIILLGLIGSLITLRALFLFNGSFGVAAFLFNGGLAGFLFFQSFALKDYQADVAWKSIPLAMFVTQRGLLYAVPAGLLLLHHWRTTLLDRRREKGMPAWAEWLLYCTMPLFHLHTFLFLSFLLFWWFLFGDPNWRGHLLRLILLSLIPATFCVYVVTGFAKTGAIGWKPDWMAGPNEAPWWFWLQNFGLFLPASFALLVYLLIPAKPLARDAKQRIRLLFFPATVVFIICTVIKFAPWEWDNTKLFFWAYLVMMFCLWDAFLVKWHPLLRAPVLFGLFFSGFISLVGGICAQSRRVWDWPGKRMATGSGCDPLVPSDHRVRDLSDLQSSDLSQWAPSYHGFSRASLEPRARLSTDRGETVSADEFRGPVGKILLKNWAPITCSGGRSKKQITRILQKNGSEPAGWSPKVPGVGSMICTALPTLHNRGTRPEACAV